MIVIQTVSLIVLAIMFFPVCASATAFEKLKLKHENKYATALIIVMIILQILWYKLLYWLEVAFARINPNTSIWINVLASVIPIIIIIITIFFLENKEIDDDYDD